MDTLQNVLPIIITIVVILVAAAVLGGLGFLILKARRKSAEANQALVVSGGKDGPKIYVSGGTWVPPFHKFDYFPLSAIVIKSNDKSALTGKMVPVVVEWAATVFANTDDPDSLKKAVVGFGGLTPDQIADALQPTLDGVVRSIVAGMTPTELVTDNAKFTERVSTQVKEKMDALGFSVRSMVIRDVTDRKGHYDDLAAEDREDKRRTAKKLTAKANEEIAVAEAAADEVSKGAEQQRDIAIADQQREVALRRAAIKAETDAAEADAAVAGELRRELRNQELAAREGEVAVVREQQRRAAAEARREVELTEAETQKQTEAVQAEAAKQQSEIRAAAEARQAEIAAEAAARVARQRATGEAEAAKARAQGEAEAAAARAQGEAEAIERTTAAKAKQVRETGTAEAEVARAKGEAEAAAILARGKAEAEAERELAEARAAHGAVNKEIEIARIESETRIRVATAYGEAMHEVGKNVTLVQTGGSGNGGGVLSSLLGDIPALAKQLDVTNTTLNGESFNNTLAGLVRSVMGKQDGTVIDGEVVEQTAPAAKLSASADDSAEDSSSDESGDDAQDDTSTDLR